MNRLSLVLTYISGQVLIFWQEGQKVYKLILQFWYDKQYTIKRLSDILFCIEKIFSFNLISSVIESRTLIVLFIVIFKILSLSKQLYL